MICSKCGTTKVKSFYKGEQVCPNCAVNDFKDELGEMFEPIIKWMNKFTGVK